MATDEGAPTPSRLRPLLLIVLGGLVIVLLVMKLGGSTGPEPAPAGQARPAQRGGETQSLDPAALDVKIEALAVERPALSDSERNPFRFRAAAASAPAPPAGGGGSRPPTQAGPAPPPQPPPPPPITVKFIGTIEPPEGEMVAIFTDCTVGRRSVTVREGATILGQYRLVKIGLQSVVVEHLDGKGRTTLPKTGQECVK